MLREIKNIPKNQKKVGIFPKITHENIEFETIAIGAIIPKSDNSIRCNA
jgi:hypothetical protein